MKNVKINRNRFERILNTFSNNVFRSNEDVSLGFQPKGNLEKGMLR